MLYANLSRNGASEIGTAVLPQATGSRRRCFMLLKNGRFFVLYTTKTKNCAPPGCKTQTGMQVASHRQKMLANKTTNSPRCKMQDTFILRVMSTSSKPPLLGFFIYSLVLASRFLTCFLFFNCLTCIAVISQQSN